ncbi:MAG TPA: DNA-directed RNA polymerase subunit RpoH/Rpb5 C-terminal domain-containing protein [archaeon]|nr:DNA-directed RNA polymerase subunit RpoH/Rpb5 C-terminal domain-containing protein [archaeon]
MEEKEINIFESRIVPRHELLNDEEKALLLNELNAGPGQLPKMNADDPVSKKLGAKKGNVVRITRVSEGETVLYYRVVV